MTTTATPPNVTLALDELTLRLSAPTVALLAQVTTFWCDTFFLAEQLGGPVPATLHIDFRTAGTIQPAPPDVAPIYAAPDLTVWKCAAGFLLRCGESWLRLDLTSDYAEGVLTAGFWATRPQDQRDFFLLTLLMFGHRHGYYGLHANGVSNGRHAYLIVGPSGSGKSTLALRLIAQGWAHAGDDVVLLHADRNQAAAINVLALRRDFAFSAKTLAYCAPELTGIQHANAATAPGDKTLIASAHFNAAPGCLHLQPDYLLFATLVDQAQSQLERLDQAQSLVRLAHQSAGLLSDRTVAPAQMQLLARLCRQAQSYQLSLGRDVLTDPTQVAALLHALP